MAKKKKGKSKGAKVIDPTVERDQLILDYNKLENQIVQANLQNTELSRHKASLVLTLSGLEVDLKNLLQKNKTELEEAQNKYDLEYQIHNETIKNREKDIESRAIEMATTHELRSDIETLRQTVEQKQKKYEDQLIFHANEEKQLESHTFSLRMQLTEASRQKFKEVNDGLEARSTEHVAATSKEASIRNEALEEELFHHSKEIVQMMDEYDATEVQLVKLRRNREIKRSAVELVQERMRSYTDRALEFGSVVNETSSHIVELEANLQQTEYLIQPETIDQLKYEINKTKSEAISIAQAINRRYDSVLSSKHKTNKKLSSSTSSFTKKKEETSFNVSTKNHNSGGNKHRKQGLLNQLEDNNDDGVDEELLRKMNAMMMDDLGSESVDESERKEEMDQIWQSASMKMSDINWS
mmetsp:Transcript_24348/g.28662  ORF Transcript_24348/g.28662 Transcript_24348/m.28662 type:complete len:412 (+) Transcript_24348:59-1294(+)